MRAAVGWLIALALLECDTAAGQDQPEPVYLRQHFLLASGDGTPSLKWGSTNAYTRWLALGGPQRPDPAVLAELRAAAELQLLEPSRFVDVVEGSVTLRFDLPRYGVSLVEVGCWP